MVPKKIIVCQWFELSTVLKQLEGVTTRSMVDVLSGLYSPFLKGDNSAFFAAIAIGLFQQTEYRSIE